MKNSREKEIFETLKKLVSEGKTEGSLSMFGHNFNYDVEYPELFAEGEEFYKVFDELRVKYAKDGNTVLVCLTASVGDEDEDIYLAYDIAAATDLEELRKEDYNRKTFKNDVFCTCHADGYEIPTWLDESWIKVDSNSPNGLCEAFNIAMLKTIEIFLQKFENYKNGISANLL